MWKLKRKVNKEILKKLLLIAVCIIIVMMVIPPKRHYKVNEKYYKEHGIEYNIVKCPECGRDIADVQQFCYNCGAIFFDVDEETIEVLNKVNENLKPTKKEIVIGMSKKIFFYILLISFVYFFIEFILNIINKFIKKFN